VQFKYDGVCADADEGRVGRIGCWTKLKLEAGFANLQLLTVAVIVGLRYT
jgi:hypothetical protein